ncbi:hypothetical protein HZA97_07590 [Candidatus Woesearchaeota archaeon]|nr:hypothetical protein [Candidatus Woesearchaeota archaeon]
MVQNKTELDKLILESQDFPEVEVNKGADCFREELDYLLKNIFSGVEKNISITSCDYFYCYSDKTNYKPQLVLGRMNGGMFIPHSITRYVTIKTADEKYQDIINDNSEIAPIKIRVYDSRFLEPAKTFAKAYQKWSGQEATITKEYTSTEENAQKMIKLEGIIGTAKKGEEKITNINELVEEPRVTLRVTFVRSDEAMRKLREEKQETLLEEVKQELEKIIKQKLEKGFCVGGSDTSPWFIDYEYGEMRIPLSVSECKLFFKTKFAYGLTVECDYINFSNSKKVSYIELGVWSEQYLESATILANKLKEELDAPVKITQHY